MIFINNNEFLNAAFSTLDEGEAAWVTGFCGDPNQIPHGLWRGRPVEHQLPFFIRPDRNNFISISTFHKSSDGLYHRRKSNFHAMHMLMIDDIGTKVSHEKIVLPPSALVGTSPGNFQGWYFLETPERDIRRASLLIERLIEKGLTADGRDPGMRGVTRYGRLPVGVNGKAKYVEQLGQPYIQHVHIWNPELRYSVDKLATAFGLNMASDNSSRGSSKAPAPISATSLLPQLEKYGLYAGPIDAASGIHRIRCPWFQEHTDQDESGTAYFEPAEGNGWRGGFHCHHGHCQTRDIQSLQYFLNTVERLTSRKQK